MDQQQHLESCISHLSSTKTSLPKIYRCLKEIVKVLDKYSSEEGMLPTERFIPCCLFVVPEKICQVIGHNPEELLLEKPEKIGHRLLVATYLKGMLKLLNESDPEIKHIIVEGMSKSITLVNPYPPIMKNWLKALFELWGTSNENLEISLRCHLAISKFMRLCQSNDYMWALRRMYVTYFANCKQVSWRNFEHINFMNNSFCQIVKFDTERSYYVLFGYLRSICLELDKLHKSKRKQKVDQINKLFSNQILNCFKLFTSVISRVDSEELTALIYPLCEMFAAYERATESAEFIPLKLHLLEYELTIIECLGVYIPHTLQLIEKLIKYPIFNKKISKKSEKVQANIELAYKLSKSDLTQALLINQLFRSLITKVFWFESLMCKVVYGPEVLLKLNRILKKQKYFFSQYQQQTQKAASLIKSDAETVYKMRAEEKLNLSSKKIKKFEQKLKGTILSGPQKYLQLKEQEEQLLKNKLAAEQEEGTEGDEGEEGEERVVEDDDQVNSGWEEASQGASELDPKELEDEDDKDDEDGDEEEMEDISYEGDPEDADQAAKQWSEEEWSSQND